MRPTLPHLLTSSSTSPAASPDMKLLHIAAAAAAAQHHKEEEDHHDAHDSITSSSTFTLRLVAIFVVLAAGLLGVLPPLIGTWLSGSPNAVAARLIRTCSGGIILSLAMIHIIPEALEQLEGVAPGGMQLGGVMVILGVLGMLVLEYVCTYVSASRLSRRHDDNHHQLPTTTQLDAHNDNKGAAINDNKDLKDHHHTSHDQHPQHQHQAVVVVQHAALVPSLGNDPDCRQQPACHSAAVKQQVVCVTMELGCVFHSVVLGLALGVMTDAPSLVLTLLVVLAVHQAIEGLALGSVLAATQRLSLRKKVVLAIIYALTLPAGVAAGLLASSSYDPESPQAVRVQGVANGLSGGMLIYVSLFSLLAAELNQHDLLHRPRLAAGLLLAVLLGAGVMSVLGIWA